jgi:hypothetical protein
MLNKDTFVGKGKCDDFTKMFIATYQIIWCYIVNFNETYPKSNAKSKSNSWQPQPPSSTQ